MWVPAVRPRAVFDFTLRLKLWGYPCSFKRLCVSTYPRGSVLPTLVALVDIVEIGTGAPLPLRGRNGDWGTHLHPLVSRILGRLRFQKWTLREWHRYFGGYSVRAWAELHADKGGRGSRWSVRGWVEYFCTHKQVYTTVVWTLIFLNITPDIAWNLYRTQTRWAKNKGQEDDADEEKRDHDKGGRSSAL